MAAVTSRSRTVNGVPTSLADLGYTDIGLDDYWQTCGSYGPDKCTYHTEEGSPVVNPAKFPSMQVREEEVQDREHLSNLRIYDPRHDVAVCWLIHRHSSTLNRPTSPLFAIF